MASFKDFLVQNKNKNEDRINEDIIFNLRAEPLAEYIVEAFRTLESKHLKVVDYELVTDENLIDTDTVNYKHIKNKKNKKFIKRMSISRSRYDLLKIRFHMKAKDGEKFHEIKLLLFKRYKKYYYMIDGNKFYPIYQLVDASTYTTKDYLTLKTLIQPLTIKRNNNKLITVDGEILYVPEYVLCIFKNKLNPLYMYMGLMGYQNTLTFMEMNKIIRTEPFRKYDEEKEYCFPTQGGLYVKVIKYFFDNDLFVRAMTFSIVDVTQECTSMTDLNSVDYWCYMLGKTTKLKANDKNNTDKIKMFIKGKSILISFVRILDNITRNNLRLESFNKQSVFAILRWMMRNFNELKMKDNMDLKNKRIRMAEYIAAYLIKKLSPRMNKFMANNDVTLDNLETLVNMEQDYLIKIVIGSKKPLLRYDNQTNDMDMFTALKYTIKGPGAIGEKSSNAVNDKYRGIHPSYVGKIDINTCSNSDPGMTSILTPFVKMYGKYFTDENEPQTWDSNFNNMYRNYFKGEDKDIYSLDYFYEKEKQSRKAIKRLENIRHFIDKDPYVEDGVIALDVTKSKVRKVKVTFKEGKKKDKTRKVKIKRIKE